MKLLAPEDWMRLLTGCRREAVHLEMRDVYAVADEKDRFARWQAGRPPTPAEDEEYWADWTDMIGQITGSGRMVRRARIVSEPVTDYIRYEHEGTAFNIAAGEQVRWLPRRHASDLALPGNDFWLIDSATVVFNHFTGDGEWAANEITADPRAAALCGTAFEAVWQRAIPHQDYLLA
ncbi:DUF6879 family protein [Actinomadura macrotermitis]|uniref:DUF6879 domain-containing protein n=1 Tax=Actinomadura macrotermitis TaxID=2585200 RepID=A0A7K0C212_9ACTN|nr:DUF6879 family protein [Actinomadura macrotermitis]MQY07503.1 hypothetical protein [Actinomadura macrotermitis]